MGAGRVWMDGGDGVTETVEQVITAEAYKGFIGEGYPTVEGGGTAEA